MTAFAISPTLVYGNKFISWFAKVKENWINEILEIPCQKFLYLIRAHCTCLEREDLKAVADY